MLSISLEEISNYYPISPVIEIKELNQGTTSEAKLVITKNTKYIFRKLRNIEQAETEFLLSEELSKHNISPSILLSNQNFPYIKNNDEVYNLQKYIQNYNLNSKEINFKHLGKTISLFHSKSKDISGIRDQEDRFILEIMSKKMMEMEGFYHFEYKNELLDLVNQCMNYHHIMNCYIHGDLGTWNLLFNHDNIHIIDFGEVRKGNNHFDVSAVLSSILDLEQEDSVLVSSLRDFQKGYTSNFDVFSWNDLKEHLSIWYVRGIVAMIVSHGINGKTINYTKRVLESEKQFDKIINTYFL